MLFQKVGQTTSLATSVTLLLLQIPHVQGESGFDMCNVGEVGKIDIPMFNETASQRGYKKGSIKDSNGNIYGPAQCVARKCASGYQLEGSCTVDKPCISVDRMEDPNCRKLSKGTYFWESCCKATTENENYWVPFNYFWNNPSESEWVDESDLNYFHTMEALNEIPTQNSDRCGTTCESFTYWEPDHRCLADEDICTNYFKNGEQFAHKQVKQLGFPAFLNRLSCQLVPGAKYNKDVLLVNGSEQVGTDSFNVANPTECYDKCYNTNHCAFWTYYGVPNTTNCYLKSRGDEADDVNDHFSPNNRRCSGHIATPEDPGRVGE